MKNMSDKEKSAEDLKQINDIFKEHSLDCWLDYGTLLGAIRNKDFLPWDVDIDLGYIGNEENFYKIKDIFDKKGWKMFPKCGGLKILNPEHTSKIDIALYALEGSEFYRVWARANRLGSIMDFIIWILSLYPAEYKYEGTFSLSTLKKISNMIGMLPNPVRKTALFIATRVYNTIGCLKGKTVIPMEYFQPLKPFNFKDINMFIPNNSEKYLELLYGSDWRIPNKDWYWGK